MLDDEPCTAEIDGLTFLSFEQTVLERCREIMMKALMSGANLADAEREVLTSLGFEKVGEFRSQLESHLGGPAEIPEEDLAIYVPAGEGRGQAFREALEEQLKRISVRPETPLPIVEEELIEPLADEEPIEFDIDEEVPVDEGLVPWDPFAEGDIQEEPGEIVHEAKLVVTTPDEVEDLEKVVPEGDEPIKGINPVPMLTAALEAIGVEGEDFGFLLRYGRYAPEGRKSEFIVGGLGLADLSDRLASWLKKQAPMDAQVQVVDEGSGELTIYLLAQETW
jgi:hypothetical protein